MSKPRTLASVIAGFFGRSEKAISEKLSSEEHAEFAADVTDIDQNIEAQATENSRLTAELETATTQVTTLEASIAEKDGQIATLSAQLATVTGERDTYKAHYEKAADKGDKNPDQDHNSRNKGVAKSSYNENALSVWHKTHK